VNDPRNLAQFLTLLAAVGYTDGADMETSSATKMTTFNY